MGDPDDPHPKQQHRRGRVASRSRLSPRSLPELVGDTQFDAVRALRLRAAGFRACPQTIPPAASAGLPADGGAP
jgi:hypothetical protein